MMLFTDSFFQFNLNVECDWEDSHISYPPKHNWNGMKTHLNLLFVMRPTDCKITLDIGCSRLELQQQRLDVLFPNGISIQRTLDKIFFTLHVNHFWSGFSIHFNFHFISSVIVENYRRKCVVDAHTAHTLAANSKHLAAEEIIIESNFLVRNTLLLFHFLLFNRNFRFYVATATADDDENHETEPTNGQSENRWFIVCSFFLAFVHFTPIFESIKSRIQNHNRNLNLFACGRMLPIANDLFCNLIKFFGLFPSLRLCEKIYQTKRVSDIFPVCFLCAATTTHIHRHFCSALSLL